MASPLLSVVITAFLLPAVVDAFCYTAGEDFLLGPRDQRLPYCEYHGMRLAPGSNFEDLDRCRQVSCDPKGRLGVCATGKNAGVFALPEGCLVVDDICVAKTIQDPVISARCPLLNNAS